MSNIAALNAAALNAASAATTALAPLVVPARIKELDLSGALSRLFPIINAAADGGNISGRHLPLNGAAYAALVGRMTADSVALALAYAAVHYHNGTQGLDALADAPNGKGKATLPPWLSGAVRRTFEGAKRAGGVTPDLLRTVTLGMAHVINGGHAPAKKVTAPAKAPSAVTVTAPTLAPDVDRLPSPILGLTVPNWAMETGAMVREGETGVFRPDFTRQAYAPAPVAAPAPALAPAAAPTLAPAVSNDYPSDARAFVLAVGEEKARKFLEALAATLAPASVPAPAAEPVRKPRQRKAA